MSEPRSKRSDLLGAIIAGLTVVAFSLLLLWHDPLVFWNDDYELSVLPVFADVARSWSEGHLPLLSPYSWVCSNLAGEFQYGTFSVFVNTAVVLIWKFPLTFPQQAATLSITHLFVLAAGAFLLARDRLGVHEIVEGPSPPASVALGRGRLSSPSGRGGRRSCLGRELTCGSFALSVFVALVATLNGWIICWGATDWFGALGAFAWLPWAWWALEKSLWTVRTCPRFKSGDVSPQSDIGHKRLMMAALWPAPFVYLLVTGGFPYTVLMLTVLVVWLSIKAMWERRNNRDTKVPPTLSILPMLAGVALGFGMSAPAWLALFDYVHGSAREAQAASAHWQWIVPWRALPGFILPCWSANWADFSTRYLPHTATELACGLVAPAALIAGLISRARVLVRRIKWELFLLVFVLLLSMLPMFGVFRWSFRWLPFVHLVLALCAAEALQALRMRNQAASTLPWPGSTTPATAALALVVLSAIAMWILHTGGPFAFPLIWIFLGLASIWIIADLFLPNEPLRQWMAALVTFAALLATYFYIPPNCGVPKYNFSQKLTKPEPLDRQRLYLAVYSPAEFAYRREYRSGPVGEVARPGNTAMWAQLRFINGYSPILAAGVAREFKFFIHGEIDGDVGKYLVQNQSGPGGILEELGVDGIVIAREIAVEPPASAWQLEFSNDDGRMFHRKGEPFARVRSINWIDSRPDQEFVNASISRINDSRNSVVADVDVPGGDRPALLTFSRPYLRGYDGRMGGQRLAVDSYRGLFPIVEVPAGSHGQLVLSYRPAWLIYGGAVAFASCAVFATGLLAAARDFRSRLL